LEGKHGGTLSRGVRIRKDGRKKLSPGVRKEVDFPLGGGESRPLRRGGTHGVITQKDADGLKKSGPGKKEDIVTTNPTPSQGGKRQHTRGRKRIERGKGTGGRVEGGPAHPDQGKEGDITSQGRTNALDQAQRTGKETRESTSKEKG